MSVHLRSILVVEKHVELRRGLLRALAEAGHKVKGVAGVDTAIGLVPASRFDVVICDVSSSTKVGDPIRLLTAVKTATRPPAVIFITAYGTVTAATTLIKAGAEDFIQKPFYIEDLECRVEQVLQRRAPRDVFLCHAGPDKVGIVRPFVKELERTGITYWLDEAQIGWGHRITEKVNEGLAGCRFVIVFLTEAFLQGNWPQSELASALNAETQSGDLVVLPILVAAPERVFAKYALLRDKRYLNWNSGVKNMARELKSLLKKA